MGRPEADSSSYDESVQPQEDQYEQTQGDFSAHAYETSYDDPSQSQYGDTTANNPQDQQQPPPPPPQQQQQPPQANQGYGGQPAQPSQFPPQGPQTSPMYSNGPRRPAPYPPQGPQANPTQPAPYPPQAKPAQPAPYPPQGPQANPTQPAPYPPQGPAQFPPQSPMKPAVYPAQGPHTFPNQPAQFPPQSPQMYNNGLNQPPNFPPQGPQQMPQAFPQQAFQNSYQAQPQVGQFPPKSPVNGIPVAPVNQQQQAWTTGIFDCLEDPSNALITALFPCVTFGQIAEIVDNGQSTCATNGMMYGLVASCIGMPCLLSCGYRSKLRAKYGLIEDPAPDWLTHCIFEWMAGKYIDAEYAAGSSWYGASDEPENDALMLMLITRDTDVI
ncbi:hypothetical protein DKX38_018552 [Salix brachista]|uniref:Uncharacterized protein n=1 Tax=Salix brachista TaxID=2182728 RepID=A0A5N5KNB1_9ROSI|nr:hypothetical protein DKX38_018552 [Salix brachista]